MSKFNPKAQRPQATRTVTHEGGAGWRPPVLQELTLAAAVTFANEDTFYERGRDRLDRLRRLVHEAADQDPAAVAELVRDLRDKYKIRTAAIVVAAEYAAWARAHNYTTRGRHPLPPRLEVPRVITTALQRADEPAELIAYWQEHYGEGTSPQRRAHLPAGVRKGVAHAARRLFTQRAALKWDPAERQIRMGDVLELTHPRPIDRDQAALFKFLLDERHRGDGFGRITGDEHHLEILKQSHAMGQVPIDERRAWLRRNAGSLHQFGYTWERLSGWLPDGMDAEAWEAIIPSMGVMALIKNLRNFDDARVSEDTIDRVIAKITNQDDVWDSMLLPYRAYTAYVNAPSDNWKRALGRTLDIASGNVPTMDRTLVVIDISLSMRDPVSNRSTVSRAALAGLQALTVARRSNADTVIFAERSARLDHVVPNWRRWSTLESVAGVEQLMRLGVVGGGTWGNTAIAAHYTPDRHDHVLLFTDGQMHDHAGLIQHVPSVVTFNIGGYVPVSNWGRGRINVAGYSDTVYGVINRLLYND